MRTCKVKINDKDYSLTLNRDSIKWLESNGFTLEEFSNKPITYFDMICMSLFMANHKDVNPSLAQKLMESYEKDGKKPAKIIKFAIEEYRSFMNALADIDSTESDEDLEIIEN